MDDEEAPPNTARFTHRHAAFFIILKGKTGLMVARAAALWIIINTDGISVTIRTGINRLKPILRNTILDEMTCWFCQYLSKPWY